MKKILILFIGLPFICFSQCPDAKSNEYKTKAEKYGDTSYSLLAAYFLYKCECKNGTENPEQVKQYIDGLVDQYNNIKDASQNSNGIEIEGQHKVQWITINKEPKCTKSTNSSIQKENSNTTQNAISSKVTKQVNDISSDLTNGNSNLAGNKSIVMATEGVIDGNNKQLVGGLLLGAVSLLTKNNNSNNTLQTEISESNGYWVQKQYLNGYKRGKYLISKDRDFTQIMGMDYRTKEVTYEFYRNIALKAFFNTDIDTDIVELFNREKHTKEKYFYKASTKSINANNPKESFEDQELLSSEITNGVGANETIETKTWINGELSLHKKESSLEDYRQNDVDETKDKNITGFNKQYHSDGNIAHNFEFSYKRLLPNKTYKSFYKNGQLIYEIKVDDMHQIINKELIIYKPNGEISHTEYIDTFYDANSGKLKKRSTNLYYSTREPINYSKPQTIIRYYNDGIVKNKWKIEALGKKNILFTTTSYNENGVSDETIKNETKTKEMQKGYIGFLYY